MAHIENGIIESTSLGMEDRGIFTAFLNLRFDGTGQSFGGYAFDQYDKALDRRVGTAYGMEFISRILAVVGVGSWEQLPGKHIRVERDSPYGQIIRIGNIVENKWVAAGEIDGTPR
jgi:hypothetical protein